MHILTVLSALDILLLLFTSILITSILDNTFSSVQL